jgi:hypothetical protein
LLTALSVLLFAGCSADSSMPESELEPDIEPFVPSNLLKRLNDTW